MKEKSKTMAKFTIGRLAKAADVAITTVRYYQKRGLVRLPERTKEGGFRAYSDQDLEKLLLIRRAQELGFTLNEIADLIAYIESRNHRAIRAIATNKLKAIKDQVRRLEEVRKSLALLIAKCPDGEENPDECPFILEIRNLHGH